MPAELSLTPSAVPNAVYRQVRNEIVANRPEKAPADAECGAGAEAREKDVHTRCARSAHTNTAASRVQRVMRYTVSLLVLLAGCSAPRVIPQDLRISCGTRGGFAGSEQGFVIERDGSVRRWDGSDSNDLVPEERIESLWRAISATSFVQWTGSMPANMMAVLEVRGGRQMRRAVFPLSSTSDKDLREIHAMCMDAAAAAVVD